MYLYIVAGISDNFLNYAMILTNRKCFPMIKKIFSYLFYVIDELFDLRRRSHQLHVEVQRYALWSRCLQQQGAWSHHTLTLARHPNYATAPTPQRTPTFCSSYIAWNSSSRRRNHFNSNHLLLYYLYSFN